MLYIRKGPFCTKKQNKIELLPLSECIVLAECNSCRSVSIGGTVVELRSWNYGHGAMVMELRSWSYGRGATVMELRSWSYSHGATAVL